MTQPATTPTTPDKRFHQMSNIGKAKYVVNHCDGIKTHKDGSAFYDISIFSNKRKLNRFLRELRKDGYVEKPFNPH